MMEQPEVKAKMDETRKAQEQLRQREYTLVFKQMDRRQVSAFRKMLGKPFDLALLANGFFRGQRGPNGGPGQTKAAAKSDTTARSDTTSNAAADNTAAAAEKSDSTPKTTTRRPQSLRERRGLRRQQPQADSPN